MKAGTLPHSSCSNRFFWESVQFDIGNGQPKSTKEKESEEEMCNEEEEHSDDDSQSGDNEELVHGYATHGYVCS